MTTEGEQAGALSRRDEILLMVRERGFVRVAKLSERFGVSVVTIRADLDALEAASFIRRIRGGAIPAEHLSAELRERPFEESQVKASEAKEHIAVAAANLIEPGMSLLLDVGTTTAAVAREIVRRSNLTDLTVITNGLSIALALEAAIPRIRVVVSGGTLRPLQHSLVAPLAEAVLGRVHADLAIVGCNGVDVETGVTNINLAEAEIKSAMVRASERVIVVADGSKIGRVSLGLIAPLGEVDVLVTDDSAEPSVHADLVAMSSLRVITTENLMTDTPDMSGVMSR